MDRRLNNILKSEIHKLKKELTELKKELLSEFLKIKSSPSTDLIAVIVSYLALFITIYVAVHITTLSHAFSYFIIYGIISLFFICVAVPLIYNTFIKKRSLSETGITTKYWRTSLILSLILGMSTYVTILTSFHISFYRLLALMMVSTAIGLSETIFFRGWLQIRFEESFGAVPTIFIGAILYAVYHMAYGIPPSQIWIFFVFGMIFAVIFRLTKNILILWPFYVWIGSLYALVITGIKMIPWLNYGFVIIIVLILLFIGLMYYGYSKGIN